ncbi:MAG TPA: aldehyde dehydrogenase family protein, partial [Pyrinomonadaceae bacterium]|nr:aldehyde dehydrogenase family protein [Pyrinomonadaceae bacterium]
MSTQILPSTQKREIVSVNPSTREELGRVPLMSTSEVAAAVSRAREAQQAWAQLSYRARAEYVLRAREIVLAHVDEIAALISRETGKPCA